MKRAYIFSNQDNILVMARNQSSATLNKRILLIVIILISLFSASWAQQRPLLPCYATGVDGDLSFTATGGQKIVTVSTVNNCLNYVVSESLGWLSYSKSSFTVTFTCQENTGPARNGTVNTWRYTHVCRSILLLAGSSWQHFRK